MAAQPGSTSTVQAVAVDYAQLLAPPSADNDLSSVIELAYGYDGLGILTVTNVPKVADLRQRCLPKAHEFAQLPDDVKEKYVHEQSSYSFGWSHGKEKMSEGKPDTSKGSYYFNPSHDQPFDPNTPEGAAAVRDYASFAHPNIWPSEEDCPGFRSACKELGQLIVDVGSLLAAHIDAYVERRVGGEGGGLHRVVTTSRVTKARLLYYFPLSSEAAVSPALAADPLGSWCGWHNDHGSLTGLAPAMYVDARTGQEVACPDAQAGLWVKSRKGEPVRVVTGSNTLAYQIGECAQVHSGGVLQATPHAVRAALGPHAAGVARCTLAVFMEPHWTAPMSIPAGADPEAVLRGSRGELLPPGVPPLATRWKVEGGQTFGQFTEATLKAYYG